ncbi:hypothetical protein AB0E81_35315 [Streptomyces sp. NPDC033538]|uniref:ATP-dependent DNA ligase n=1 Tax=Streptomyces sp. NPDC033538 TaxID=3155367 RepID=UPI0033F9CEEC
MSHETPRSLEKDGFRAQLARWADGRVLLRSRQGTAMTASFPEILDAALAQLPDDTGLDGELVVWEGERLAFERLQQRLARRRGAGITAAARAWPAHLVFRVRRPAPSRHRPHPLALSPAPDRPGDAVRGHAPGRAVHAVPVDHRPRRRAGVAQMDVRRSGGAVLQEAVGAVPRECQGVGQVQGPRRHRIWRGAVRPW